MSIKIGFKTLLLFQLAIVLSACQEEVFTTEGMAHDVFFLRNEGQDMPVHVIGNVDSKKMIFIIHGGPGGNGLEYRDEFVEKNIESQFGVIYWDQRYAGNSQGKGGSKNIKDFANDMAKIIQLVKSKYGQDQKVYLFGHSWGGFLAPYFLLQGNNESLVNGWIQIGGAHNYELNDRLTREMLLFYGNQELASNNNIDFWNNVVEWCNNNSHLGIDNVNQLNAFAQEAETMFDFIIESNLANPIFNNNSVAANRLNEKLSGSLEIDLQAYQVTISDNLSKITLPTLLVWGKYDFVCPPGLANDIEANVGSQDLISFLLDKSGHSPMVNEPVKFWNEIIYWLSIH